MVTFSRPFLSGDLLATYTTIDLFLSDAFLDQAFIFQPLVTDIVYNVIPIDRFGEVDKGVLTITNRAALGRWLLFTTKKYGDLASGRHQR